MLPETKGLFFNPVMVGLVLLILKECPRLGELTEGRRLGRNQRCAVRSWGFCKTRPPGASGPGRALCTPLEPGWVVFRGGKAVLTWEWEDGRKRCSSCVAY